MKKYIFYTSEGFTENNNFEQVENCQILDWQNGKDEKEAFENFKKENPSIDFEKICCQELANDKIYYL
ncbi:hypothetical protein KAS42_03895 [bacterium]|nr:hypothetical protein [bacterium]